MPSHPYVKGLRRLNRGYRSLTGQLQKALSLASLQGRHSFQEFVQRETRREVVDQHLHWNPSPSKAGCSRKSVRVDPHNFLQPAKEFWSHTFNVTAKRRPAL